MLSRHAALPPQHHAPHCAPLTSAVRVAACVLMVASSTPAAAEEQPLPTDQYFEEYGQLYDHVGMLQDHVRMGAYYDAIRLNAARHFKGKVVLDVGAGTGVLSIWAAKAGARRVFAVEATGVATHAEALVRAHGLSDVVTVLRGRMEQLELPEKVDVILSEWMGYFLLRESMVSSVLYARDKWLRPGGAMYPSEARLLLAPMSEPGYLEGREASVEDTMENWDALSSSVRACDCACVALCFPALMSRVVCSARLTSRSCPTATVSRWRPCVRRTWMRMSTTLTGRRGKAPSAPARSSARPRCCSMWICIRSQTRSSLAGRARSRCRRSKSRRRKQLSPHCQSACSAAGSTFDSARAAMPARAMAMAARRLVSSCRRRRKRRTLIGPRRLWCSIRL